MKTWIGVVVMVLAAAGVACGGEETKTCERLSDPQTCINANTEALRQCTMTSQELVSGCDEAAYREAASCLECAPCAEYAPAFNCYADCEVAFRVCRAGGDTPDNCLAAKINCFNVCNAAHVCSAI